MGCCASQEAKARKAEEDAADAAERRDKARAAARPPPRAPTIHAPRPSPWLASPASVASVATPTAARIRRAQNNGQCVARRVISSTYCGLSIQSDDIWMELKPVS